MLNRRNMLSGAGCGLALMASGAPAVASTEPLYNAVVWQTFPFGTDITVGNVYGRSKRKIHDTTLTTFRDQDEPFVQSLRAKYNKQKIYFVFMDDKGNYSNRFYSENAGSTWILSTEKNIPFWPSERYGNISGVGGWNNIGLK